MVDFMAASLLITGETALDCGLAEAYWSHLTKEPNSALAMSTLLVACDSALREKDPEAALVAAMKQDQALSAIVQSVAFLWFSGSPRGVEGAVTDFISPESYFSGLLWKVAGAHPPGLSGGYSGHWRYRPDA